ncbi:MAG TPA: DUF5908 family protein [Enhygromyxa sp.]|nr:DUF5908 family protein [Enhygromyxa sp.]
MTIEIRQLIIRASAEARREPASPSPASPSPVEVRSAAAPDQREAIVAACVREVLRELKRARER